MWGKRGKIPAGGLDKSVILKFGVEEYTFETLRSKTVVLRPHGCALYCKWKTVLRPSFFANLIIGCLSLVVLLSSAVWAREDLVVQYLKAQYGTNLGLFTVKKVNLEPVGDKADEYVVSFRGSMFCGSAGCTHDVLQVRDRTVRQLLSVTTGDVEPIDGESRHGLKSLKLSGGNGPGALWAFDGNEYQFVRKLELAPAVAPKPSVSPVRPAPVMPSAVPAQGWGSVPIGRPNPPIDLREVQASLNMLGFCVGPVDGAMGERTRNAIAAFKRNRPEWSDKSELSARVTDAFVAVLREVRVASGNSNKCAEMARAVRRGVSGAYFFQTRTGTGILYSLLTLAPNRRFEINVRLGPLPEKHVALIRGYYEQQGILVLLETQQSDAPTFPRNVAFKILNNGDLLSEHGETYKRLPQ